MLNREIVRAWFDEAVDSVEYGEEPVLPEGVEALDAAECDELLARLSGFSRAVRFLQDGAKRRLAEHLGSRGFVRFGERTYRASPETKETLKPDRRNEFYDLIEARDLVAEVFPTYTARKTGLRKVADGWLNEETGEVGWGGFRDYFYDVEEGDVRVSEMPASKAPKFISQADDGVVQKRGDAA